MVNLLTRMARRIKMVRKLFESRLVVNDPVQEREWVTMTVTVTVKQVLTMDPATTIWRTWPLLHLLTSVIRLLTSDIKMFPLG